MTTAPTWSPVDDETADLLSLVADEGHPSADYEWAVYEKALFDIASSNGGLISPNLLRSRVRGKVAPRRIGAFANRALKSGLVEYTGEWVESTDHEGRNAGKPCRQMRLMTPEAASRRLGSTAPGDGP